MARVSEHMESAIKFYELGTSEYENGKKASDLIGMREGCEKVFHAYVEACSAIIQKSGLPEPESHADRTEALYKLGERELVEVGVHAFMFLHKHAYYDWRILPGVEESFKEVDKAIKYVKRKLKRY